MAEKKKEGIDVDYVAKLARIELTEEEKKKLAKELSNVLTHFENLSAVDTKHVEALAHPFSVYNVWEDDEPSETFTPKEALMNAPAKKDNQVQVPKVVN